MEWINVADQLPESALSVWVNVNYGEDGYGTQAILGPDGHWRTFPGCEVILDRVTHWMPLPSPPEQPNA